MKQSDTPSVSIEEVAALSFIKGSVHKEIQLYASKLGVPARYLAAAIAEHLINEILVNAEHVQVVRSNSPKALGRGSAPAVDENSRGNGSHSGHAHEAANEVHPHPKVKQRGRPKGGHVTKKGRESISKHMKNYWAAKKEKETNFRLTADLTRGESRRSTGSAGFWANLSSKQRKAEMRRRKKVAARNKTKAAKGLPVKKSHKKTAKLTQVLA
jgi:hypothetical protein